MKQRGKSGFDILEEAVMLLRCAPLSVWLRYYLGTLPFIAGFLYFLQFMSQSAIAHRYITWAAFWLALSFLWMKVWHTAFTNGLWSLRVGESPPPHDRHFWFRVVRFHAANQWWSLLLFIWAFVVAIPFGWVNAYCQKSTILCGMADITHPNREALRLTFCQHLQNQMITFVLVLFGFFVFLNVFSAALILPQLVKILLGVDSTLSIAGLSLINTSFLMICLSITYVLVDPFIKASYLLRVFYLRSTKTGEDLLSQTKALSKTGWKSGRLASLMVLMFIAVPQIWGYATGPQADPNASIDPQKLSQKIEKVIAKQEYTWRMPRAEMDIEESGLDLFFRQISEGIAASFRSIGDAIDRVLDWIRRLSENETKDAPQRGISDIPVDAILIITVILLVVILAWVILKRLGKQPIATSTQPEAVAWTPDLTSEEIVATDLAEDQWLVLAKQYLEKGDFRLALRAYYLSLLAMLEAKALIKVTRAKSNLDYLREVRRRRHAYPGLDDCFKKNIRLFERVWYGLYQVNPDELILFQQNRERMGDVVQN